MPAIIGKNGRVVVPTQPHPAPTPAPVAAAPTAPIRPAQAVAANEQNKFPTGPPVPVLQQTKSWSGSITDFNDRAQQAHDAYQKAYGVKPPPNLILDLAASPVSAEHFPTMFTVPTNPVAAKARGAIVASGRKPAALNPDEPALTVRDITVGMVDAAARGGYDRFVRDHADVIRTMQNDPATASKVNGAITQAKLVDQRHQTVGQGGSSQPGMPSDYGNPNNLVSPSDRDTYAAAADAGVGSLGKFVAKAVGQVADSLVHSPAGVYEVAKAAGLDASDAVAYGFAQVPGHSSYDQQHGNLSFTRTRKLGKATAKGTLQDVEHPGENPGYLFLDALGLATGVAGGAARAGAAARAVSEAGEEASVLGKAGAAAKALGRKPELQRATVSYGGYTEQMPLSQNPLVAAAQKGILKVRQGRAEAAAARGGPLRMILLPESLQSALEEHLSLPKKLGREADARKRVEHVAQTQLQRELDAVAGRSVMQARVLSRVPQKIRGGLSRGEQKAIQVLATDDPTPLETERGFHQRMIEQGIGDPKAHRRQLADLRLAEKALNNPSPRFRKALELTRKTVSEMERIKVEDLGLLPETAEGRVIKFGAVLRDEGHTPVERLTDDGFYLPVQLRGKVKRPPSDRAGYFPTKAGPFGVPPGRSLPELTHEFTGKAIEAGDYRIDSTSLASEAYGRTVRAATIRAEHAKLWKSASETPRSRFDVPIRDSNTIPDKLRTVIARLDEGDFTQADADILPADARALIEELYPDPRKVTGEKIDGVRWVDSRLLGEGNKVPYTPGLGSKIGDVVNGPFRFVNLYARPAYILNKLGNQAMLVFDQGVFSTAKNMIRAMNGDDLYGEENMRTIRALTGSGHSRSLVNSNVSKVGQGVAEFWNRVADRDERSASFIHYMNLKGYKTEADVTRLLNDKTSRPDLVEITRRSNKALVEFDNLTPIEKNYIRHWVYVYPWVSRSAVWSIRAILDHPMKTALLAQLGKQDIQNDPLNGRVVEWVKRAGYVPLGWDHHGNPKVVNPSSVNTFSTIGDFLALTRAATEGDKYASAEDFLGPLPRYALHAITGRDEYGNQYPGSQWLDAAKEVLQGLPQITAYERGGKAGKPGSQANVGSRSSLLASFNHNLKQTVLSPGWLDGYGTLLVGGFSTRNLNMDAAAARYWNDQDPKVKHQRELDLLNRALDVQGSVLKRDVPAGVRTAVKDQAQITYAAQQFQKDHGRAPTDKERAQLTLAYLAKQGLVPAGTASKLRTNLNSLVDPHDISVFKNALVTKYGHGGQLRQWDTDIRTVASFTPDVFNAKAAKLYQQGLAPQRRYQVSDTKLQDYGRKYIEFTHEVAALQKQITDGTKTDADLRAFQDTHDVPVDGLPSFVRIAWTHQTDQEQQQHIASAATSSWADLSAFDKQLLGVTSDAKVTAGWAKLKATVAEQRTTLEREGRSFPKGYARTLAKWVQTNFDAPGLVKDFDFSQEPLFRRMQAFKPIRDSPNSDQWTGLFQVAARYQQYLKSGSYNQTQVRQAWRDYVQSPDFQGWLNDHPGFRGEIGGYGRKFLNSLIG